MKNKDYRRVYEQCRKYFASGGNHRVLAHQKLIWIRSFLDEWQLKRFNETFSIFNKKYIDWCAETGKITFMKGYRRERIILDAIEFIKNNTSLPIPFLGYGYMDCRPMSPNYYGNKTIYHHGEWVAAKYYGVYCSVFGSHPSWTIFQGEWAYIYQVIDGRSTCVSKISLDPIDNDLPF